MTDDTNKKAQEEEATDDVVIEEIENEDGEGINPAGTIKKLREKLKKAVEEKQEYLNGWQRDKADFVNAKKREDEARKELVKYANEELVHEIIPALDSFDMAMGNREAWEKVDKNWRIGVEYIYSQLVGALERVGVKQENPIGQKFNPAIHEPTENIATDNKEDDGKVLVVLQKGYILNSKQIRPAKVKVGEYKIEQSK